MCFFLLLFFYLLKSCWVAHEYRVCFVSGELFVFRSILRVERTVERIICYHKRQLKIKDHWTSSLVPFGQLSPFRSLLQAPEQITTPAPHLPSETDSYYPQPPSYNLSTALPSIEFAPLHLF